MKSLVLTSILGLSLSLPLRAGAQEQPAVPTVQEQPAAPATQAQPAAPATQAQPEAPLPQEQPPPPAELPALQLRPAPLASPAVAPTVATAVAVPAQKSPGAATAWALSSTAVSAGMLATGLSQNKAGLAWVGLVGLTVGPSFGYFYAGDGSRAWKQIGLRAGAVGAMFTGLVAGFFECGFSSDCNPVVGSTLLLGGLAVGAGSVVYSIYDAPRAAKRYNARQQRLTFTPAPIVGPDRTSGLGLQLGGTF